MAYTTCLNFDKDLGWTGLWDISLYSFKRSTRFGDLNVATSDSFNEGE